MNGDFALAAAPLMALGGLLAALSVVDLAGREPGEVAGGWKLPWYAVAVAIPIGPVAYLLLGRKERRGSG